MTNILNQPIEDVRKTTAGKYIQGASHTCHVLNHKIRNQIIIKAVCDLRKIATNFDSIACCGVSGLTVVPQIAEILNKDMVIIRKPDEKRYSNFYMEGASPFRYVVVDDLICSGDTLKWIKQTIHEDNPKAQCVGLYCYMPEECTYRSNNVKEFEKRYRIPLLNPYLVKS
jgi:adenine/guanine phosphoribosyltransferase-like PRPP-binding protein